MEVQVNVTVDQRYWFLTLWRAVKWVAWADYRLRMFCVKVDTEGVTV